MAQGNVAMKWHVCMHADVFTGSALAMAQGNVVMMRHMCMHADVCTGSALTACIP
jgi:hypothetical protein